MTYCCNSNEQLKLIFEILLEFQIAISSVLFVIMNYFSFIVSAVLLISCISNIAEIAHYFELKFITFWSGNITESVDYN